MNEIQASGLPRNSLDVLDLPPRYSAEEATHFRGRDKYVVATDLILGVELGDEALAYPIQILNWHEVVNDTLAGVPIVVSYSPLTGTIAAFDRRVGDQTLEFGFSGLLLETHSLLFDRSDEPSLWSPLLGRAISGPAAARGDTLRPIHAQFVPWSVWSKRHPEAEVLTRDEAKIMAYRRSPYGEYYGNDILRFPVSKLPPDRETYPYKSRIIAVRNHGRLVRLPPRRPRPPGRSSRDLRNHPGRRRPPLHRLLRRPDHRVRRSRRPHGLVRLPTDDVVRLVLRSLEPLDRTLPGWLRLAQRSRTGSPPGFEGRNLQGSRPAPRQLGREELQRSTTAGTSGKVQRSQAPPFGAQATSSLRTRGSPRRNRHAQIPHR